MGNCLTTPSEPKENGNTKKLRGTVVLMKKNTLDMHDMCSSFVDRVYEFFGNGVSLQLISTSHPQQDSNSGVEKGNGQLLGKEAYLEDWKTKLTSLTAGEDSFNVTFELDESMGVPGAVIVRNHHHSQFFLKTLILEDLPDQEGPLHFVCNSWVYPTKYYKYDRVFFANKTYLPCDTPEPLRYYREQELVILRGNGTQKLKEADRVYDYAHYNDLGMPEKGKDYARPVLGGSETHPYPRRVRTNRKPNSHDRNTESRLFLLSINIYVPRDEIFNTVKMSDFLAYSAKSIGQVIASEAAALIDKTPHEFDKFDDILKLYDDEVPLTNGFLHNKIKQCLPWELLKELTRSDGEKFLHFPMPAVIKESRTAWRTDEEFGREMLAGVNPVIIRRLQEFPPASKLDPNVYGDHTSSMTREDVEKNMNGLSVDEALENQKLFILDHHDAIMPYLSQINTTSAKIYATRTLLLLQEDGTLKPLAIELSLPQEEGNPPGVKSKVYTPEEDGVKGSIWQLAKAYAAVNDSGYHQLISHWLNTHAVIEPFIIAANRQLSVLHPIFKLLHPHFRNTLYVNALARQILINANGVLERTCFPCRYAMEMSSGVYKSWNFTEQGLPADLLKRGVAVPDPSQPGGVKLLIEDYPFAVDGLEIWAAIEEWVNDYCSFYYTTDASVQDDTELQAWWSEIRNEGHGDLKNQPWWPKMQNRSDLIQSCTIIIWVASALHAAVNFGQYPYAGFLPNRPTVSRRFMPEPGTPEYKELEDNPELGFLKTITAQLQTLLGVSLIEMLSRHSADEVYLGKREDTEWTSDENAREAFDSFGKKLEKIEKAIVERNDDERLKNRMGPVKMKYTLLYPGLSDPGANLGLTGKGIPNSVSI